MRISVLFALFPGLLLGVIACDDRRVDEVVYTHPDSESSPAANQDTATATDTSPEIGCDTQSDTQSEISTETDTNTATETETVVVIPTVTKTLVTDLVPALKATGGLVVEKVEGMAATLNGDVFVVNDNDGVDNNSGETRLLALGNLQNGSTQPVAPPSLQSNFVRIATFPVCLQDDLLCDSDNETVSEIAAVNGDGDIVVYTDSPGKRVGFVDLILPWNPHPLGTVALSGEPTSVVVKGSYAIVAVNTSQDYVAVSGELAIIDFSDFTNVHIVTTIDVGGQPDSLSISPDGSYIAVAIENERDEEIWVDMDCDTDTDDLVEGGLPQFPAGTLVIIDSSLADVTGWTETAWSPVNLTGLAHIAGRDPEPEYVDINSDNIAVVTMQENNHIVLVDVTNGNIVNDFSAGTANLTMVDATEEAPALIMQTESLNSVPREPDGVAWIDTNYFVTADEGDLFGGSRGFTVFDANTGEIVYTSNNELEHLAARIGHYPDSRSENKGVEIENVDFGVFGGRDMIFVASERGNFVAVYDVTAKDAPSFRQVLPTTAGPEGVLAVPSRNLLIASGEEDSREDNMRAGLNIYQFKENTQETYPTIESLDREDGSKTPIPWSALSGLAASVTEANIIYAVEDSYYQLSRIFTVDVGATPALITSEIRIRDTNDVLASIAVSALADDSVADDDITRANVFDEADLNAMINDDKTVNLDLEGIAVSASGGFWLVSEGSGAMGEADRPINSINLLLKADETGTIEQVVTLPDSVNDFQSRFGFEGVAEYAGKIYVAFQRAWNGEKEPRIGVYDPATSNWAFYFYPLAPVASKNGGWVGLSELTSLGNGTFLVLERDNQAGPDAAIKRIYSFDINSLTPAP